MPQLGREAEETAPDVSRWGSFPGCIGGCMGEDEFAHWLELPAGTKHVRFGDLPHLIALAIWPDRGVEDTVRDFEYGGARINLEAQLPKAVDEGQLAVLDPLTFGPHSFPHGDALNGSRVLLSELRRYLAPAIGVRFSKDGRVAPAIDVPEADELTSIALLAKDAAKTEHPAEPEETAAQRDIRVTRRNTTEKQFLARLSEFMRQGRLHAVNPFNGTRYDPAAPEMNADDPQWSVTPAERHTALELLGQLVRTDEAGLTGWSLQSSARHHLETVTKAARQLKGFYTLRESAQLLADAYDLNAQKVLSDFIAAFEEKKLTVRDPETEAPTRAARVRDFYDWVTPDDVNRLLADVWRVSYRFPVDGTSSMRVESGAPFANSGTTHIVTLPGAPRARWTLALEQLLPQLEAQLKRAAKTREVARYLKENGASFFIAADGGPDQLYWTTEQGDKKLVTKKTLQNQISEYRNRKRPPG